LRRADRVPGGDRGHLAAGHRADLHRAPDPGRDAVRVPYADRKKVAAALRPIYTAPTADAAEAELLAFADSELGRKYPAAVQAWENAWERFIPFLTFPPQVRKIIYTTNAIESLNYQLRKIIKNRGHFPMTPSSSCSGWPSATSKTSVPEPAPRRRAYPPTSAAPPPASSKAPSSKAGDKPSAHSPCTTPNASTPTSANPNF
jgi:hypothetical protein